MKISQEILVKSGLLPRLRLGTKVPGGGVKSTGPHTVKILDDKIVTKPIREEGDDGLYVRYTVEENGEKKQYDTRLKQKGSNDPSYFVQTMAAVEPGEEVVLEMKRAGQKNYIEIIRPSLGEVSSADVEEEDHGEETIDADA